MEDLAHTGVKTPCELHSSDVSEELTVDLSASHSQRIIDISRTEQKGHLSTAPSYRIRSRSVTLHSTSWTGTSADAQCSLGHSLSDGLEVHETSHTVFDRGYRRIFHPDSRLTAVIMNAKLLPDARQCTLSCPKKTWMTTNSFFSLLTLLTPCLTLRSASFKS